MKKLLVLFFSLSLSCCGTLPKKRVLNLATSFVELGVIGEKKTSIRKTDYQVFGVPTYHKKIKASVVLKSFDSQLYKRYQSATKEISVQNALNYVDSIQSKPIFAEITLLDKVIIVSTLSDDSAISKYIKNYPNSSIVTKVRLVPSQEEIQKIKNADTFYLQTKNTKEQVLQLFSKGQSVGSISLSKNTVFEYGISSFCWKTTSRRKVVLSSLVSQGEKCMRPTHKNPQKLEKKLVKNGFKF